MNGFGSFDDIAKSIEKVRPVGRQYLTNAAPMLCV
jgi:hypothetical protein